LFEGLKLGVGWGSAGRERPVEPVERDGYPSLLPPCAQPGVVEVSVCRHNDVRRCLAHRISELVRGAAEIRAGIDEDPGAVELEKVGRIVSKGNGTDGAHWPPV
jgi:hypothetical protein